jgi:hypothetical protein
MLVAAGCHPETPKLQYSATNLAGKVSERNGAFPMLIVSVQPRFADLPWDFFHFAQRTF